MTSDPSKPEETLYCSFCGKSQHFVEKLVAGPSVYICDECVISVLCAMAGLAPGVASEEDIRDLRDAILPLVRQRFIHQPDGEA